MSQDHAVIMQELVELARSWRGKTGYNPTVAAAVVVKGTIIATGVHHGDGTDHAEIMAIKAAGEQCKDATLYVTLEPCTHYGKTPPCVDAIVKAGFSSVVYAIEDPNPDVRAQGGATKVLSEAGKEVVSSVCEAEAYEVNREFFYTMEHKMPFVTLKVAQSLNGRIPTGSDGVAQMISGDEFLKEVHRLRAQCDAVLTGVGTILADNPRFDVRYGLKDDGYRDPAVFILDPEGKTQPDARLFESDRDVVVIVDVDRCDVESVRQQHKLAQIVPCESHEGVFDWKSVCDSVMRLGYRHLLVEAGPTTVSWVRAHVQEIILGVSPLVLADNAFASPIDWRDCSVGFFAQFLGHDIVLRKIDT